MRSKRYYTVKILDLNTLGAYHMLLVDPGVSEHRLEPARHKQEGLAIHGFFCRYVLNSIRLFICI